MSPKLENFLKRGFWELRMKHNLGFLFRRRSSLEIVRKINDLTRKKLELAKKGDSTLILDYQIKALQWVLRGN